VKWNYFFEDINIADNFIGTAIILVNAKLKKNIPKK